MFSTPRRWWSHSLTVEILEIEHHARRAGVQHFDDQFRVIGGARSSDFADPRTHAGTSIRQSSRVAARRRKIRGLVAAVTIAQAPHAWLTPARGDARQTCGGNGVKNCRNPAGSSLCAEPAGSVVGVEKPLNALSRHCHEEFSRFRERLRLPRRSLRLLLAPGIGYFRSILQALWWEAVPAGDYMLHIIEIGRCPRSV